MSQRKRIEDIHHEVTFLANTEYKNNIFALSNLIKERYGVWFNLSYREDGKVITSVDIDTIPRHFYDPSVEQNLTKEKKNPTDIYDEAMELFRMPAYKMDLKAIAQFIQEKYGVWPDLSFTETGDISVGLSHGQINRNTHGQ